MLKQNLEEMRLTSGTLIGVCAEVGLGKEFFVALTKNYMWTQKSELVTSNLVKSLVRFF